MCVIILSGAIRFPSCVIDIPPIHEVTPVPFRFAVLPSDISFTGISSIESLSCGTLDDRAIARRDSEMVTSEALAPVDRHTSILEKTDPTDEKYKNDNPIQ